MLNKVRSAKKNSLQSDITIKHMKLIRTLKFRIRQINISSKFIVLIILCGISIYLGLKIRAKCVTRIVHYKSNYTKGTLCYDIEDDDIPLVNGNFSPPAESIFFHETSCKGYLSSRQVCSIESTIRAHPNRPIYILFTGPVNTHSLNYVTIKYLQQLGNVKIARIRLVEYAKGTLLEPMISYNIFKGITGVLQAADILKYLTLYKYGGLYLDLDMLVVKSLDGLPKNFVARQDNSLVGAAIISLSRDKIGRHVARLALKELQSFHPKVWYHFGPRIITKALLQTCATDDVLSMSALNCYGFEVYDAKNFYPNHYDRWMYYFQPNEMIIKSVDVYTYHVWSQLSRNIKVSKSSFYSNLAKHYCPSAYEMYATDFGN